MKRLSLISASLLFAAPALAAGGLTLPEALRAGWSGNPALRAGEAEAEAAAAQARAADAARMPTLSLGARALRTDEPMAAFGLKLDQGRIGAADFAPAQLNAPDAIYGWGLSASITQPLYAGGRIDAGRHAQQALAGAAAQDQERRKQEVALSIVEAYFGAEVAGQAVQFAEDQLAQAKETESFVRARVAQAAMLESEGLRATAFRAQAESELATARQRLETARSGLALLVGDDAAGATLTTPLETAAPQPLAQQAAARPDLLAAHARTRAAEAGADAARGSLLPEVFLQLSAETARRKPDEGNSWTTAMIGARWQLSFGALEESRAAGSRAAAAASFAQWQERRASREVDEARRAIDAARARIAAAREAVAAGESVRAQRTARHRQGMLPLTEVLDAEAGLAGARTLLLRSQLESRLAVAQLQLAQGQPIEGVTP